MDKITRLNKTIPNIYNPTSNKYIKGLLEAWAQELEECAQQSENAKNEMLVSTASGNFLKSLGFDRGVPKPLLIALNDSYFRELILKMSYSPKQIRKTIYKILDIFWGPTYSRSNITCANPGPYNLGTPFGISGTVTFTKNDVVVSGAGTLFTSELEVDDFIKITTESNENFVRITRIIDDTSLIIETPTTTTKTGSVVALTPYILSITVDQDNNSDILIYPSYFVDTTSGEVDEMVEALNSESNLATFSNVSVAGESGSYVNIRTNTLGLLGKIQVTGGTANSLFAFGTSEQNLYSLDNSTFVCEINPREIIINVPSLVGQLYRALTGVAYLHNPVSVTITSVDNTLKQIVATSETSITTNSLAELIFSQNLAEAEIVSNTSGTSITLTFASDSDLSLFVAGPATTINTNFCTSFIYDTHSQYSITKNRTVLAESISEGDTKFLLSVDDSSDIPNSEGFLCFDLGKGTQENLVPYISRQNNSLIQIDPSYIFKKNHASGCIINLVNFGKYVPARDCSDYAAYLVDTEATLQVVKDFIDLVVASGFVLRWIVSSPEYRF